MSVMLRRDVRDARREMDLSRWVEYDSERKRMLLSAIGSVARSGAMPPRRYTLLHPEARLSAADAETVYEWTREARRALKQSGGAPALVSTSH